MLAERTGRSDITVQAVSWASAFTMNARLVDRYRVGCVFLAGDAAHIHPPTGGQGPEHRRTGRLQSRLEVRGGYVGRACDVHQLDIGYPESSLALEKPKRTGGLLAGDRAPDAPIRGAAGRTMRLFDLFRGPHWTLIVFEGDRGIVAPRAALHIHAIGRKGDLVDDAGHFKDAGRDGREAASMRRLFAPSMGAGANGPRRSHHVDQRRLDLIPFARFQAAIRVDP